MYATIRLGGLWGHEMVVSFCGLYNMTAQHGGAGNVHTNFSTAWLHHNYETIHSGRSYNTYDFEFESCLVTTNIFGRGPYSVAVCILGMTIMDDVLDLDL